MNTAKIIGLILLIGSIAFGYIGLNKISESSKSVEVLGLEIEASDNSGKEQGYLFVGLAVVLLIGGIYTLNKRKS